MKVPYPILMDTTGLPYLESCRIIEAAARYGLPEVDEWFFHFPRRFDRVALRIEFAQPLSDIVQIQQFLADITKTGIKAIHNGKLADYELLDVNVGDEFWLFHYQPAKGLVRLCKTEDVYNGERLPRIARTPPAEPPLRSEE